MKKLVAITIALIFIASTHSLAQKKEDVLEKIIGTWYFFGYHDLAAVNAHAEQADGCTKVVTYTFNQDGTALINSTDTSICRGELLDYWSIVSLHDDRGKERLAIRITDEKEPELANYDRNTYNDRILMIVQIKKKFVCWVRKPQYHPASSIKQSVYKKIQAQ
ncbi:MAG TPA: hypothetical protein VF008_12185 [Niastella sp.]